MRSRWRCWSSACAVLVDRSALAAGDNPIGPAALARRCAQSLARVELSTACASRMYKFMERELATALTPLYDRINARLGEAGILPRLLPSRADGRGRRSRPTRPRGQRGVRRRHRRRSEPQDHALFSSLIGMLQSWRQHMVPGRVAKRGSVRCSSPCRN